MLMFLLVQIVTLLTAFIFAQRAGARKAETRILEQLLLITTALELEKDEKIQVGGARVIRMLTESIAGGRAAYENGESRK